MIPPKEKAKELFEKIGNIQLYIDIEPRNIEGNIKYFDEDLVKECALIAVDEILDIDCKSMNEEDFDNHIEYWDEVKQEIQKL